ncbi:potassium channel protein [bacterium]|nr:potassium channel protein [bacterium]
MRRNDQTRAPQTVVISEFRRRITFVLGTIMFLMIFGMIGFHKLEGLPWLTSLYYTVSVLTTLGLPDLPGHATQAFTVILALGGIGFFLYAIGLMAQMMFSREFQLVLVRRKAQRRMKQISNHYVVCGFGRVGEKVSRDLVQHGETVIVIERDEQVLSRIELDGFNAIRGDASSEQTLEQAGVCRARALIVVTGSDAENVLITMTAHQMVPTLPVIARCEEESNAIKLTRAGATRVVTLHDTGAAQIALAATKPFVIDLLALATGTGPQAFQIVELVVPEKSPLAGQSLRQLGLGSRLGVIVIGIKPASETELRFNPPADAVIMSGDMMIAVGRAEKLQELESLLAGV